MVSWLITGSNPSIAYGSGGSVKIIMYVFKFVLWRDINNQTIFEGAKILLKVEK